MSISFNQIPSGIRVPLFYAEFDNSAAVQGGAEQVYKTLLIGNKLAAGTKPELEVQLITSAEQAAEYFGIGSVLSDMAAAYLKNNKINPLYCIAIDDNVAGALATGTITIGGTPTAAGTLSYMIGGKNVQVGVTTVDTPTTIAAALVAAITADTSLTVSAANVLGVVTLTAKNKGLHANEMDVRQNYFLGEELPAGVTSVIVAMSGGTGNPDVDEVWPVIGDDQYILMVTPWTDSQNLGKMETELDDRFGPLRQNDGYGLYGKRDTHGNLVTFGNTRNSQFTTVMGVKGPSSPWVVAASLAGQVSAAGSIDPARPFQTLKLVGVLAPAQSELFTLAERDILLHNGIATFNVDSGSNVLIESVITTFKENSFGSPDTSYLYLNTPLTLSYLRFDLKARITSRFPRHKLANDGTRFAPGQAVVTPLSIKAEVITKFQEWEEKALVEGFEQFKSDLIVERNNDNPNRVDILLPPDLVNQLRICGVKIQFLL
jgi:phage tail sheath gpL-like